MCWKKAQKHKNSVPWGQNAQKKLESEKKTEKDDQLGGTGR